MSRICIFGDSITWGASDFEKGGWVNRLRNFIDANAYDVEIYNLGIPGDKTKDLLQRFYKECKVRKSNVIIFAIWINDVKYIGNNNKSIVPLDKFQNNLEKLIIQAKNITDKIIFLGLTNVDESKTMPIFWKWKNTNMFFSTQNIIIYNSKLEEICNKSSLLFIDMLNILDNSDFNDGVHPNDKWHEKMFLKVKNFLFYNKII